MRSRLLAAFAAFVTAAPAFAACDAPRYRIARTLGTGASEVFVDLSVELGDFVPARLVCLAETLKLKYADRDVIASIFSSHEAALGYRPGDLDVPPEVREYQSKEHALYVCSREKHEEYVAIMPDPRSYGSSLTTRIDLPAKGTPECKLAINGRCLVEFHHIYYPDTEDRKAISGRVTVAGSIRRDGTVSDLAVADAKVNPPDRQSFLVDWTLQNLRTWRFAPGKQKDDIRITYDFGVTDSPSVGYVHQVEFQLPTEVRIWKPSPPLSQYATIVSTTPSAGTGFNQAFTFVVTHPAGFRAISEVGFTIASGPVPGMCMGYFEASANAVYLLSDTERLGPMTLGSSGSLHNSVCAINSADSSVAGSGNQLLLKLSFTFEPAFAGTKIIELHTVAGRLRSPRVQVGTWTVP